MQTTMECEVTEFNILPEKSNSTNTFYIDSEAVVISFLDAKGNVIMQSEIEIKDAIILAKTILLNG